MYKFPLLSLVSARKSHSSQYLDVDFSINDYYSRQASQFSTVAQGASDFLFKEEDYFCGVGEGVVEFGDYLRVESLLS